MLFERKTSKSAFQLGYVGEDFEDAQLRREEGRGYPRLPQSPIEKPMR